MLTRKGFSRAVFLLFFIFSLLWLTPVSEGLEKTFPLDKVKPGMNGFGYSVFSGTKIEKFNIKVLATVDSNYGKEKLILVKLTGKPIEVSGGLSAGMSGSPVYLSNRLVGAISYGFENADTTLALVTPIDSMLKLLTGNGQTAFWKNCRLKPIPVATPVIISGMKKRSFELVSRLLEPAGFKTVFAPGLGSSTLEMGKDLIKPGSAIAVLMVAGDYQISAIGTITWVDGKDFLAFGHSYTNKGNVNHFAYLADILQTVKSPQMSFKIGVPLKLIGRISQDRQTGILGKLEEPPDFIPVQVSVRDIDRDLTRNSIFYVVTGEPEFRDFITAGVTDAIDQAIDRVGSGTAKVTVHIETTADNIKISRENIYCSKDIAIAAVKDLSNLLEIINFNDFSTIKIKSIAVHAEVNSEEASARIVKMVAETAKIKPGDTLRVVIHLHKYRGDEVQIPLELPIPANIKPGKINLTVYGGSKETAISQEGDVKKEPFKIDYNNSGSFDELITKYLTAPRNNELVLEYDSAESKADETDKNNTDTENGNSKAVQLKSSTPFFILGEAKLTIEVQQP